MSSTTPPSGEANSALNRHFCRHCSTIISPDPSAEPVHICPHCQEELTEESELPSSSSPTTIPFPVNSEAAPVVTIYRKATFEHRNPAQNFVHLVAESDFFRCPYPNSVPYFDTLLPKTGDILELEHIKSYLDYCENQGALVKCNFFKRQLLELLENYARLWRPRSVPLSDIVSLPGVKIREDLVLSGGPECTICIEDFKTGEVAKELPCKHLFHKHCIIKWLKLNNTCPVCRFKLRAVGEQRRRASTFDIELQWPYISRFSRFEIGSSSRGQGSDGGGEGNSEDPDDNDASGSKAAFNE